MPLGDHFTTTGAALPVDQELSDAVREAIEAWGGAGVFERVAHLSSREQGEFAAIVLRTCISGGASRRVRYEL